MIYTYSPTDIVNLFGVIAIDDFNTITFQMDEQKWNTYVGTNGETTRVKASNRMGTVTLAVPQTSFNNLALSTLEKTGAMFPIILKDLDGFAFMVMEDAFINGIPQISYGDTVGIITWIFKGNINQFFNISGGKELIANIT